MQKDSWDMAPGIIDVVTCECYILHECIWHVLNWGPIAQGWITGCKAWGISADQASTEALKVWTINFPSKGVWHKAAYVENHTTRCSLDIARYQDVRGQVRWWKVTLYSRGGFHDAATMDEDKMGGGDIDMVLQHCSFPGLKTVTVQVVQWSFAYGYN